MSDGPAILAADGGNSKTDIALVGADGRLLAALRGPTVSHQAVGLEPGLDKLARLAVAAAEQAGFHRGVRPIARLGVFCLAGVDFPADARRLTRGLVARGIAAEHLVRNDTEAVLRAGAPEGWGVAVVCGAGINCAGRAPDGRTVRFPALGDISGDWGGGEDVGLAALAAAVRARDGRGPRTVLERTVPAHFAMARPVDVTTALELGRLTRARLDELPRLVYEASAEGDDVAREILDRLAEEVAAMARAVIRRLHLGRKAVRVVLGGGLMRAADQALLTRIRDGVRGTAPSAHVTVLSGPPVLGAALLGLDRLRIRERAAAEARLRAALSTEAPLVPPGSSA